MPDALSLISLVTGATSSLVSLVSSVVGAVTNTISAILSAGQAIVSSLVSIGGAIGNAVSATITTAVALGNAIVAVVGGVIQVGQAVASALGPIISSVVDALSATSGIVGAVVGAVSDFFSVVSSIGEGMSSAIGGIIDTVSATMDTAVDTVSAVFGEVGPVVSEVAESVGTAFSAVAQAGGALVGALSGVISGVVGAVTAVVGAITSVIQAITASFKAVFEALGQVASVAGDALSMFAGALQSCIESLLSFAHDVSGISMNTGMSLTDASNLTTSLRSVGVSSSDVSKTFNSPTMRPELFNARSQTLGLANLGDKDWAVHEAQNYQQIRSTQGIEVARSRLNSQFGGQAPEWAMRVANTDPRTLQQNAQYGKQVQSQLGVGSSQIKAASEDLPLLMNRVSMFVDTVKMKFAADLLPALQGAFSIVSNVLLKNAGNISNIIQTATHAIFVDGPDLAANAALTAIDWGVAIVDMFFNVANAAVALIETFGNRDGAVYQVLLMGARFVDFMVGLVAKINGGIAFIQAAFEDGIVGFIQNIINGVLGPLALIPGASDKVKETMEQFVGLKFEAQNPVDAYNDAVANSAPFKAEDAVNGVADSVHTSFDAAGARKNLQQWQSDAHNMADAGRGTVKDMLAQAGTKDERERTMQQAHLDVQKEHLAVSKQQLDVAKSQSGPHSAAQVLGRIGAYIAEDAYRLTSR